MRAPARAHGSPPPASHAAALGPPCESPGGPRASTHDACRSVRLFARQVLLRSALRSVTRSARRCAMVVAPFGAAVRDEIRTALRDGCRPFGAEVGDWPGLVVRRVSLRSASRPGTRPRRRARDGRCSGGAGLSAWRGAGLTRTVGGRLERGGVGRRRGGPMGARRRPHALLSRDGTCLSRHVFIDMRAPSTAMGGYPTTARDPPPPRPSRPHQDLSAPRSWEGRSLRAGAASPGPTGRGRRGRLPVGSTMAPRTRDPGARVRRSTGDRRVCAIARSDPRTRSLLRRR